MATRKSPMGKSKTGKASPKKVIPKKPLVKKAGASLSSNGKKAMVPFVPTKLKLLRPVPSDIEIAQAGKLKPILQIAAELSIHESEHETFGPYKATDKLENLNRRTKGPNGKNSDVTPIRPTELG